MFFHKVNVPIYPLFEYPPYELALTTKIVELVDSNMIQILHVHYAIPHAYAAVSAKKILLSKGFSIPIITTLHGTDITLLGKQPFVRSVINYAINESDLITTVSNNLKKETKKNFDIKKDIQVIPNFFDFNILNMKKNKKSLEKKVFTHISNFRPVKRVLDVINIFKNVNIKIDSELFMIGDGPEIKNAKKLVDQYNLEDKVTFFGKSNDIQRILSITDLFLLPSNSESFGLVALEAMAYSIPVITTNNGGITEVVDNNKNGFTFSVGDIKNMTKKCIELLSNPTMYARFSKNAFNKSKEFDIKKVLPLYEKCYLQLMK